MKHLIIYTHLNPASFTKAIVDKVALVSKAKGDEVQIIDLYADGFNPIVQMPDISAMFMGGETPEDVVKYQKQVAWADHITVVYPLWWGQMPALLKGFFDRVFTNGFAYSYTEDGAKSLLTGKTGHFYINTGTPNEYYKADGMHKALERVNVEGVFGFSGIKSDITFFGNVSMGTDELRKGYLASIQ